jgi:hypothetical protein
MIYDQMNMCTPRERNQEAIRRKMISLANPHLIQVFNAPYSQRRPFALNKPTITLPLIIKKLV